MERSKLRMFISALMSIRLLLKDGCQNPSLRWIREPESDRRPVGFLVLSIAEFGRTRVIKNLSLYAAPAPANRWHPSGMAINVNNQMNFPETPIPEPGGFTAISRGLRSTATTPPDRPPHASCIPEGCQP